MNAKPGRRATVNSSRALEQLRELVEALEGAQRHRLPPERELAVQLGVGRRALRRALEVLEAEGRLWRRQGKGTFVGKADGPGLRGVAGEERVARLATLTDPIEVMEVRLQIEPALAQLAALRGRPEAVERLRLLARRLNEAADSDARELWDSAFHRHIAETAGNRLFLALFELVDAIRQDSGWRQAREVARSPERLAAYRHDHEAIAEAIARRDGRGAMAAMRRHLSRLHHALLIVDVDGHAQVPDPPRVDEEMAHVP
ncbi:FadR/GntR family transcriptional regulator [Marinivivus vitaminiproducens]|uniref:FadR/GntR family transcriptional regulator n=1 Tax=Marinivivus vitaminiproducens TaxID=3035935 RepID=UPI00279ED070|nr:FCD domain-containing protein [Geminicoccaceae bacterium SCSIO 64248]